MSQNIYDKQEFFEGYGKLSRSVHGLKGAPEWDVLQKMLPDVDGLRVADLGCGYGWFCRWAQEHGASQVEGYDLSEKMLQKAKSMTEESGINYNHADLETLALSKNSFDLVYSSLTLHYIENLNRLIKNIYQSLGPGGHFVFSIEHPIFMASKNPTWIKDSEGNKTWPVDNYFSEGKRTINWLANGVIKYHRTLGTLLNLLIDTGFTIKRVEEFCPTKEQIRSKPELIEEIERPMFLLISVER